MALSPDRRVKTIAKWGFGMAPISSTMRCRYDDAVQSMLQVLERDRPLADVNTDAVSELKGMFNRCRREDQWDWASVHDEFGFPSKPVLRHTVKWLEQLRSAVIDQDEKLFEKSKFELINLNILLYLYAYQSRSESDDGGLGEWIYILSRREEPDVLKIGMTSKSVSERVKQINGHTGVLRPWSVRQVFRVKDASMVERAVFSSLAEYRMRPDREFFQLAFHEACEMIRSCINDLGQHWRHNGELKWFDPEKYYGFIGVSGQDDVFVHGSEIPHSIMKSIIPGAKVEFDLVRDGKGLRARNVALSQQFTI